MNVNVVFQIGKGRGNPSPKKHTKEITIDGEVNCKNIKKILKKQFKIRKSVCIIKVIAAWHFPTN